MATRSGNLTAKRWGYIPLTIPLWDESDLSVWPDALFALVKTVRGGWADSGAVVMISGPKRNLRLDVTDFMESRDQKDRLEYVLTSLANVTNANRIALIASAWLSGPGYKGGPSTDPNRREIVIIETATAQGEVRTWSAPIIRDRAKPPRLGLFREIERGTGRLGNDMVQNILNAMKRAVTPAKNGRSTSLVRYRRSSPARTRSHEIKQAKLVTEHER